MIELPVRSRRKPRDAAGDDAITARQFRNQNCHDRVYVRIGNNAGTEGQQTFLNQMFLTFACMHHELPQHGTSFRPLEKERKTS
jgi:hypothetical protein